MIDQILQYCATNPTAPAITQGMFEITYGNLGSTIVNLEAVLFSRVPKPGSSIVVCLSCRPSIIACLLAIINSGHIFIPIDTSWPKDRIDLVISETRPECVITEPKYSNWFASLGCDDCQDVFLWEVEGFGSGNSVYDLVRLDDNTYDDRPDCRLRYRGDKPTDAQGSYIYYTSGSTGKPKGVVGDIDAVRHFVAWEIDHLGITSGVRVSQFANPSFDAFFRDVLVPLSTGGTICIPPRPISDMGPDEIVDWLKVEEVELIHCVPSLFRIWSDLALSRIGEMSLRFILMAGEVLHPNDVVEWLKVAETKCRFINLYGTTETTMVKLFHDISMDDVHNRFIPIGCPIVDTAVVIIDKYGKLCPPGVVGEICIGGNHLTQGYFHDQELTDRLFVQSIIPELPYLRFYKTGDLARMIPGGPYQLVGRCSRIIKVRGNRVSLDEVEISVAKLTGIKDICALSMNVQGEAIAAFYTTRNSKESGAAPSESEVRAALCLTLPSYAVPQIIKQLDAMPLTANAKVDQRVLANVALEEYRKSSASIEHARYEMDSISCAVLNLWREALEKPNLSENEDFFAAGGSSLIAMKIIGGVRRMFNLTLTPSVLLSAKTALEFSQVVKSGQNPGSPCFTFNAKGKLPPIMCFPWRDGEPISYHSLASVLGNDQPLIVWPISSEQQNDSEEEIARHLAPQILRQCPSQPVRLLGFCFGGRLAFYIARELLKEGVAVAQLCLVDTASPVYEKRNVVWRLLFHLKAISKGGLIYKASYIVRTLHLTKRKRHMLQALRKIKRMVQTAQHRAKVIVLCQDRVHKKTERPPQISLYSGDMRLVILNRSTVVKFAVDPLLGWGQLVDGRISIRRVDCGHMDITRNGNVEALAEELNQYFS